MAPSTPVTSVCPKNAGVDVSAAAGGPRTPIEVGLLTGGVDKPYAFGLARALAARDVRLDFIGSDEVDSPEVRACPNLSFLNLRGDQGEQASVLAKIQRLLVYYSRLIRYASAAKPKIFHILWNNRFETFDRTLLMLYYRLLGKTIVLTAHNVNAGTRDSTDSVLNRLSLKVQYRLADHIFVHTKKMKAEIVKDFGVRDRAVTVIPFGINNLIRHTNLSPAEARRRLGIADGQKTILFFGGIMPYKGVQFLASAYRLLFLEKKTDYRLIIAGRPGRGSKQYLQDIQTILSEVNGEQVIQTLEYISDEDTDVYFKAADVLVLPYTQVFQSGVLALGYSFGLPVIATDVGSLREDIVEGQTGFICRPCDALDLKRAIETYFASDLYRRLGECRHAIVAYARERYSWETVGEMTRSVYDNLLRRDAADVAGKEI